MREEFLAQTFRVFLIFAVVFGAISFAASPNDHGMPFRVFMGFFGGFGLSGLLVVPVMAVSFVLAYYQQRGDQE